MLLYFFFLMIRRPPRSTLFPLHDALPIYSSAIRVRTEEKHLAPALAFAVGKSHPVGKGFYTRGCSDEGLSMPRRTFVRIDRKSTRLNSSHANISYAVFCLKKKNTQDNTTH